MSESIKKMIQQKEAEFEAEKEERDRHALCLFKSVSICNFVPVKPSLRRRRKSGTGTPTASLRACVEYVVK